MNACLGKNERVLAAADELSPEAETRVRDHLAACPACRAEVTELRQALGTLESLEREPHLPPALAAWVGDRLGAHRPVRPPLWRRGWVAAAAAILVVAGAVIFATRPGPVRDPTPSGPGVVRPSDSLWDPIQTELGLDEIEIELAMLEEEAGGDAPAPEPLPAPPPPEPIPEVEEQDLDEIEVFLELLSGEDV